MKNKDLEVYRKKTKGYELRFKRNGVAQNITDWIVYFTVKENMKDTDNNAKIKKDVILHLDAVNGKSLIELSSSDTDLTPKSYWYDMQVKDTDNNISILFRGRLKVIEPITQRGV